MLRNFSAAKAVAGFVFAASMALAPQLAQAADMPMKAAPAPAPTVASDIHGFIDVSFGNDYITPRGLLVTNSGLTTQILSGLVFDLYKNPNGFVQDFSITAGIWNDLWSKQDNPQVGPWKEFDWFVTGTWKLAGGWTFGVTYIDFVPPSQPNFPATEHNAEFSLAYADGFWNPYAKFFWAISGPSTVNLGKSGGTFDVELGINPKIDMTKSAAIPVVFNFPTWITVGPTTYWADGPVACGATTCDKSNFGVFSTGVKATIPLTSIPPSLGKWYIDGGVQYYHVINDALVAAQIPTGVAATYADGHRDVVAATVGFGMSW